MQTPLNEIAIVFFFGLMVAIGIGVLVSEYTGHTDNLINSYEQEER